jgi:D-glycero-D-manno-heptose 1,7-bisphosphate phosphatase
MVIRRGVLLEREGVLTRRLDVQGGAFSGDLEFLPRALEALRLFSQNNIAVRVVSHQPSVGSGHRTMRELDKQTRRLLLEIGLHGADIEKVHYCLHSYSQDCLCRKPLPGMLVTAMLEGFWGPPDTFMIGDSEADIEAASRAGCRGILLRRDAFFGTGERRQSSTEIASNLYEAAERIVQQDGSRDPITRRISPNRRTVPSPLQPLDSTDFVERPA